MISGVWIELSDFREVLGLRLPHRVSSSNERTGASISVIESVKRFEGDTAALFSRPESPCPTRDLSFCSQFSARRRRMGR
jgi:hypothetical protein